MSVVVGVESKDGVWLAADSRLSDYAEATAVTGKLFRTDSGLAFGVVGSLQHAQLIKYFLDVDPPYPAEKEDPMKWIVTKLVPALKNLCKEHDIWEWTKKSERGLMLLTVINGMLYGIQEDWTVWRALEGYSAIGSGSSAALGSLYTSYEYEPKDRCILAVEAATKHAPSCGEPIHTLFVKG